MPRKYLVNFFFAFLAIFGKKTTLASEINISRVDSDLQKIGVLTVGNFGPSIENTNLTVISRYNQIFFMKQVGQTLVETGPLGEILPGLAQSWTISENGLSYVFKLRLATFHSGHEITARDIVYSLNLAIYSVENVASLYLSDLEGYEDGKATKVCRGIKIIDKNTVSIRLTRSFSPFLKVLSSGSLAITRERSTRSDHDIFDGSGPYKVVKREGDKLFLSAFNDYSGIYPASIKDIILLSAGNPQSTAAPNSTKVLPDYNVLAIGETLKDYDPKIYAKIDTPAIVESGFYLNMRLKKYRNSQENRLNLLSLLWLAAKNIQFDHPGQTLSDFYPKGMLGHRDNRKSYADFIKELEKRAGKISSKEPICVSFHTLLGAEDKFRSEIKLLSGRDVNFLKLPGINALRDWQTYNCDAYFMTWQSVFLDPESAITPLRFLASFSDSDFRRFSTLSQKANANITDDKRVGYFDQIADVIFNSATYLPIYQPNHVQFLKKPFQLGSSSYRYQPMVSEVNKSQK